MIASSRLTYSSKPSPWFSLEFNDVVLNTLMIAIIATVLSYQLTAVIYDIVLGTKKKNLTPIHAFQTLLLVRGRALVAVLSNVLGRDWLTRLFYRQETPEDTKTSRTQQQISISVFMRLSLLLIAAPVANILSISLTLESSRDLTFAGAHMKGVAFGVNSDLSIVETEQANERCERAVIDLNPADELHTEFLICSPIMFEESRWEHNGQIEIHLYDNKRFYLHIQIGTERVGLVRTATLQVNGSDYIIHAIPDPKGMSAIMDQGIRMIAKECGANINQARAKRIFNRPGIYKLIAAEKVPCVVENEAKRKATAIAKDVGRLFTFVEARRTNVVLAEHTTSGEHRNYFPADDMPLLRRRQRYVGLYSLAGLAGICVLLRIFTAVFWNNDVADGLQMIVKNTLGLQCCSSMLHEGDRTLVFNYQHQLKDLERHEALSHNEKGTNGLMENRNSLSSLKPWFCL